MAASNLAASMIHPQPKRPLGFMGSASWMRTSMAMLVHDHAVGHVLEEIDEERHQDAKQQQSEHNAHLALH
jgi:hypothetical protein